LRKTLVIAQVALSLVLVAGAILFTRSLGNLLTVETGFRQDGILVASMQYQRLNLAEDRYNVFSNEILEKVRVTPGVESIAISDQIPLRGGGANNIWMEGADASQGASVRRSRIGPGYFNTMQIPLLAGRDFNTHDQPGSPKVAIVNQAFARKFLNGANPVGHRFWVEATPNSKQMPFEIVGLVGDTKYANLREDYNPIAYDVSAQDSTGPGVQLMIRSHLAQTETVDAIKHTINSVNPAITVDFRELSPLIEATVLRERLVATLSGFFGALALTLACIGLYGLLSYRVASRTNEIGIRMALGARKVTVFWLILREALILVSIGLAVGVPLTFALTRLAATLLFGLTPTDPLSLFFALLAMLAVAMLGGYLPSRGAARLDPMVALRRE
jgi:predicted permease